MDFPLVSRTLQSAAGPVEGRLPPDVQADLRGDLRAELVRVQRAVREARRILPARQNRPQRHDGQVLQPALPENVHSHQQPLSLQR